MEKKVGFLVNVAYYGIICAIVILFFKYGMKYVLPFVLAFAINYLFKKPIILLSEKTKLSRKGSALIVLTLAVVILLLLVILLGVKLVTSLKDVIMAVPGVYTRSVEPYIQKILQWYEVTDFIDILGPTVGAILESTAEAILTSLGSLVTNSSVRIVQWLTNVLSSFPSFLMTLLMTVISVYFIAFDYDRVLLFIKRQFSEKQMFFLEHIKENFINTVVKYLASYSLIMLITMGEMTVLMLAASVPRPVTVAFLIALFDFMPIVGISTILIPWILIDIVSGNYVQAIILAIGYVIMTVVRNIIEPKIVGEQVGIHPLLTLILMFVGLRVNGLVTMLAFPVAAVILVQLQKADIIHFYKEEPDSEPDTLQAEERISAERSDTTQS